MTDVEAGGATVFPEIGLRLVPEKVRFCLLSFLCARSYLDTVCPVWSAIGIILSSVWALWQNDASCCKSVWTRELEVPPRNAVLQL